MMKPHCDICEALLEGAANARPVTIHGLECIACVTVRADAETILCADCLRITALAFAKSLRPSIASEKIDVAVPVNLDGREIARIVVPLVTSELRRMGVI